MKTSGYSGTPLARKLGIKQGFKICILNSPDYYYSLFDELPDELQEIEDREVKKDFIHYFASSVAQLEEDLPNLRQEIEENGMIWVSWPKKTSKIESDLNENIIREMALAIGLVDVKVCAVDEVWSGLKLVIRIENRKPTTSPKNK